MSQVDCTWRPDSDGDGFGDPDAEPRFQCRDPGDGWTQALGDCDDTDSTIYPGAPELCDGIVTDCSMHELELRELDIDGDGWVECDTNGEQWRGIGTVVGGGDCNDTDPDVNPSASETAGDGIDQDCDGREICYADADDDGHRTTGTVTSSDEDCQDSGEAVAADPEGDCDDTDSSVNPGASELIANGKDDDCDGYEECYADIDGDGDGSTTVIDSSDTDCASDGESDNATDCDDTDPDVNPTAVETAADGIDGDCDGLETCYLDIDADGFGSSNTVLSADMSCSGTDEASDTGDCDDTDGSVNPGVDEVTADGLDNDCDGYEACYVDGDLDGWGSGNIVDSSDTNCTDSGEAATALDCDDDNAGRTTNCLVGGIVELASADAKFIGEAAGDEAGIAVSAAGDVNGDGHADILIGANYESTGGEHAGAAYLVNGPVTGTLDLSQADAKLVGESPYDQAGMSVSGAGDANGDGKDDLLVGAYMERSGGQHAGAAYLVYGPVAGTLDLSLADAKLVGEVPSGFAHFVSGAGDMDDNGMDDLLVGACCVDNEDSGNAGAAYLVLSPVSGTRSLSSADAKIVGEAASEVVGISLSGGGDVDGDGIPDILLGARAADHVGVAYLVSGPVSGTLGVSTAEARFVGEEPHDKAGESVAIAGDVDGDGNDDILLGARGLGSGANDAGAAYLMLGPVTGTHDLSSADAKLVGEATGDGAGWSVSGAGDVDGDGMDDILVGAIGEQSGGPLAGATYLVLGPVSGTVSLSSAEVKLVGEAPPASVGSSVAGVGDVDGDGRVDLLIGARREGSGGSYAGAVYLVLGGGL